ncbi:MAG: nicotinamidase-related amidase/type 1 glutamine amidotransferase [Pirellulaceae bacterium]|jgi:nicotinamidase-related amidase/type 1 glutamine amidotransferase
MSFTWKLLFLSLVTFLVSNSFFVNSSTAEQPMDLSLRYQIESLAGSGRYHQLHKEAKWKPSETAVIVCDVWDSHHSINAVRRVQEFAPRLNDLLNKARATGATIIHSPSDCMPAYEKHPARIRAMNVKPPSKLPHDIQSWCSVIPAEENGVYPIDQSDGGEDDDPKEHAVWVAKLKQEGRNPGTPWLAQNSLIEIDSGKDFISDRGDEVWNILEERGIKNVVLTGVHVNMCVLGRPFGLRQMARTGKRVVLVRDMTDTMYNPQRWPYVSHFTGTDLIISHIERFVCPTITSDQILGGKPFQFKGDKRPHLAIVIGEQEYETNVTLPEFASNYLGQMFRVSFVHASPDDRDVLPGLEVLDEADLALISVRRRTLAPDQLEILRRFVAAGKPVVGIRTASHAFSLHGKPAPAGKAHWPEFDAQVFGGNYTGHYGNNLVSTVSVVKTALKHPAVRDIAPTQPFRQGGSLYKTAPLAPGARTLLSGAIEGQNDEPIAWTFKRQDGGRSFYTSLGHKDDFKNPVFVRLLVNSLRWATDLPATVVPIHDPTTRFGKQWTLMPVPQSWHEATGEAFEDFVGVAWYRCSVRLPSDWIDPKGLHVDVPCKDCQVWFNGNKMTPKNGRFAIDNNWIDADDANLLVVRLPQGRGDRGFKTAPRVYSGSEQLELNGRWQFRVGDSPDWSNIPLPARYGTSPDIVFEP